MFVGIKGKRWIRRDEGRKKEEKKRKERRRRSDGGRGIEKIEKKRGEKSEVRKERWNR